MRLVPLVFGQRQVEGTARRSTKRKSYATLIVFGNWSGVSFDPHPFILPYHVWTKPMEGIVKDVALCCLIISSLSKPSHLFFRNCFSRLTCNFGGFSYGFWGPNLKLCGRTQIEPWVLHRQRVLQTFNMVICYANPWWCMMYECDVWCDVWCMMWRVMYNVWCAMYDVWCVMYDVWCVMYDVWCVMYDVWCMMYDHGDDNDNNGDDNAAGEEDASAGGGWHHKKEMQISCKAPCAIKVCSSKLKFQIKIASPTTRDHAHIAKLKTEGLPPKKKGQHSQPALLGDAPSHNVTWSFCLHFIISNSQIQIPTSLKTDLAPPSPGMAKQNCDLEYSSERCAWEHGERDDG